MANEKSLAERAWQATKGESDPDFNAITNLSFKEELNYRAEKVRETGVTTTNFEKECAKIIAEEPQDPAPMAVVKDAQTDGGPNDTGEVDPDEVRPDGTKKNTYTEAQAEEHANGEASDEDKIAALIKDNDREALDKLAKKAGLDGNKFTSKPEVAKAIIAAQKEKAKGDQSGHVPSEVQEEKAAILKEEATAPLHP